MPGVKPSPGSRVCFTAWEESAQSDPDGDAPAGQAFQPGSGAFGAAGLRSDDEPSTPLTNPHPMS
ncbi:hypothetical protein GCM10010442_17790 [Kitasatospora kifunensis]